MTAFRPKFVTFDCYGTLTNFDMAGFSGPGGPIPKSFTKRCNVPAS